jgi:hypothetical protein
MHLNHDLDVVSYMRARGMTDERNLWQRLPFRKEEKYFFRAPMSVKPALAPAAVPHVGGDKAASG